MNYVDSLNLFGVEAKEISCIKFEGSPTESTVGAVGMLGMDIITGDVWKCTAVDGSKYTWESFSEGAPDAVKYTPQTLTEEQKARARENIGAVSKDEIPNSINTVTKTGEIVTVNPIVNSTVNVVSKFTGRDINFLYANELCLQHISSKNLYDVSALFGGPGTVIEKDGLTAVINDDGTATITGTNTLDNWNNILMVTSISGTQHRCYFPAGTYSTPKSLQFNGVLCNSSWVSTGNFNGTFTIDAPFMPNMVYISYPAGAVVNETVPLVLVSGHTLPNRDYNYVGKKYTVKFTNRVSDGVFDWQTGELKDTNGNLIETVQGFDDFSAFDGSNTFTTGIGDTTVTYQVDGNSSGNSDSVTDSFDPTAWGLPVLNLSGATVGMSKDNAVTLNYEFDGKTGTASVKWQGSSSLSYLKKNYTIKFDNAFEAAPGWGEQKKYCLKANYIDHSHARNIVNAKLWGQIVKSRPQPNLFSIDDVTGAYVGNTPKALNKVENGVITCFDTLYNMGAVHFKGPTFPAGKYKVSFDILNPDTFGDGYPADFKVHFCSDTGVSPSYRPTYSFTELNTWIHFDLEIEAQYELNHFAIYANGDSTHVQGHNYQVTNIVIQEIGLESLPNGGAIDGFPVVITLNGDFHGLYTFNIPKDGWMFGMGGRTQEAILCAGNACPANGFKEEATLVDKNDLEVEYITDEDNATWAVTSVNNLIRACINSNGTDLDTTIANMLDWQSAIDYYIFTVLVDGHDMTLKNYLLVTFDGTKWYFSAYDMDSTHGLYWDGQIFLTANADPTFVSFANQHRVMELIKTYKKDDLKARYAQLRETVLSESNLATLVNNFIGKIPSPVYMQDIKRWPMIPNSSTNNASQIRDYYRMRVEYADKWIEEL